MGYDCVFDSEELRWGSWEEKLEFDRESKPQVSILFQKESVVLHADCHGGAVFHDVSGNLLHEGKADAEAFFSSVYVGVRDGEISVRFPVTKWVDHYPHCDGEHDRWSEIIVDNVYVCCPVR